MWYLKFNKNWYIYKPSTLKYYFRRKLWDDFNLGVYKDQRILTLQYLGIDSECVEDEKVDTEKIKKLPFATPRKQSILYMMSVRKNFKDL